MPHENYDTDDAIPLFRIPVILMCALLGGAKKAAFLSTDIHKKNAVNEDIQN